MARMRGPLLHVRLGPVIGVVRACLSRRALRRARLVPRLVNVELPSASIETTKRPGTHFSPGVSSKKKSAGPVPTSLKLPSSPNVKWNGPAMFTVIVLPVSRLVKIA